MSPDLQRLSNEVFLGIKAAHETLMKLLGAPSRSTGTQRPTGGIRPIAAEGTARTTSMRPTGAMPRLSISGTTPPEAQLARGTDRSAPTTRTSTPAMGVKISAAAQSGSIPRTAESGSMPGHSGSVPRANESGAIPRTGVGTSGRTPVPTPPTPNGTVPLARQGTPAPGQTSPLAPRPPTLQPGQTSPLARQGAPGQTAPLARQGTPAPGQTSPLARQPTPAPGQTSPLARQPTPAPGQTSPLARPGVPASAHNFNPPTQRGFQSGGSPSPDPARPPAPSSTNFNVSTQRGVAPSQPTQPLQRAPAAFDENAALIEALGLMEQRNWSAARQSLHALAAKVPQSKQYRALLCYSRGREAQAAGRGDEALLEYQRALQLDPDLGQVKQAVAELQRRR
jgi:hypothetical protein